MVKNQPETKDIRVAKNEYQIVEEQSGFFRAIPEGSWLSGTSGLTEKGRLFFPCFPLITLTHRCGLAQPIYGRDK
jgi:hypothetical protein